VLNTIGLSNALVKVSGTGYHQSKKLHYIQVTMTLREIQPQLMALSPEEKTQAIHILQMGLSQDRSGIEKTPGVMGGDACIRQTRIPVWLLVSLRQQGGTEAYILEDYPTLTAADLVNTWDYAAANAEEIQIALDRQEAA
jgi:uncharacterized protein (DUF433 family)